MKKRMGLLNLVCVIGLASLIGTGCLTTTAAIRAKYQRILEEGRRDYVANRDLTADVSGNILAGKVSIGMTQADVLASWGAPDGKNKSVHVGFTTEQWIYPQRYLYFRNGVLRSWQETVRRRSRPLPRSRYRPYGGSGFRWPNGDPMVY